jgi:cytoskeleton protein RodZ
MDEEVDSPADAAMTVGERLRAAREAAGMSLDELATATRIPTRHLASLEASDFAKLPAPTYTIGFAKNYAAAVGLNRAEIAEDLRAELGSTRPQTFEVETYEPADPRRAMPKGLIIGALAAILLVVLGFTWLNNRALEGDDEPVAVTANEPAPAAAAPATPATAPAVTLTATDAVWVEIKDGMTILKQGQMAAGESFAVPADAAAPLLTTGKPEALTIKVGETTVPPVGEAGKRVKDVSLLAADLTRPRAAPVAAAPPASPSPALARRAQPAPAPRQTQPAPVQPAPPASEPPPTATNTQ